MENESPTIVKNDALRIPSLAEQIKQGLWSKYQNCLKSARDLHYDKERGNDTPNDNKLAEFKANLKDLSFELYPKIKKLSKGEATYPSLAKAGTLEAEGLNAKDWEKCLYELRDALEELGVTDITPKAAASEFELFKRPGT